MKRYVAIYSRARIIIEQHTNRIESIDICVSVNVLHPQRTTHSGLDEYIRLDGLRGKKKIKYYVLWNELEHFAHET